MEQSSLPLFEVWSDWLKVRTQVAPIGLGLGLELGLVISVSYRVCVTHFLIYISDMQPTF